MGHRMGSLSGPHWLVPWAERLKWQPQTGQKGYLPQLPPEFEAASTLWPSSGRKTPPHRSDPNSADLSAAPLGPACGGRLSKVRGLDRLSRHTRLLVGTEPEVLLEDEEEGVLLPTVVDHQRQRQVLKLHRSELDYGGGAPGGPTGQLWIFGALDATRTSGGVETGAHLGLQPGGRCPHHPGPYGQTIFR